MTRASTRRRQHPRRLPPASVTRDGHMTCPRCAGSIAPLTRDEHDDDARLYGCITPEGPPPGATVICWWFCRRCVQGGALLGLPDGLRWPQGATSAAVQPVVRGGEAGRGAGQRGRTRQRPER